MKVTNKNLGKFIGFLVIFAVAGTLAWDLAEVLLNAAGLPVRLDAGPIGFDIDVLSVYIFVNPGTFLGGVAGWLLFRKI